MTPNSTHHELDNLLSLLVDASVATITTKVIQRQLPGGRRRVTWAPPSGSSGHLFRDEMSTVQNYRDWIECGGFSAVLFDGALLQISYDFANSELVSHRLLYFPCPFDLDDELVQEFSLLELIDMYCDSTIKSVRLRTPLRFDYSRQAQADSHPASHLTFQWPHVRVPVMSPISPGHFTQFVFRNFYPEMWAVHSFLREWPRRDLARTITGEEQETLHLSARY